MAAFEELLNHYFIAEAISLKNAKSQRLSKKYSGAYGGNLDAVFGEKNRILESITIDYSNLKHELYTKIDNFLYQHNYGITDMASYIRGVAYKMDEDFNYDTKNPIRIGKLLEKYETTTTIEVTTRVGGRKTTKTIAGKPLLKEFKNDPIRSTNGEFVIVISRHPYDVAGSSTDRNWTSCMDLGLPKINYPSNRSVAGSNKKFVSRDIEQGTLIAYIVTKDELYDGPNGEKKVKLQRPLSRILIKPHPSDKGKAYSVGKMYGNHYPEFYQKIKEWVSKNLNNKLTGDEKVYPNRELYNDTDTPVDFKFNSGDSIADEVLTDALSFNNEKELGNEITFETTGGYNVDFEIQMDFRFGDDIVESFDYLDTISRHDIMSIYPILEKQIATEIFDALSLSGYVDPHITVTSLGDGMEVQVEFSVRVSSEEDKYIDREYIYDTLNYAVSGLTNFNYRELKTKLYALCSSYNKDEHNSRVKKDLDKSLTYFKATLQNLLDSKIVSMDTLSSLVVVTPEELLQNGPSALIQYGAILKRVEESLLAINGFRLNIIRGIPSAIRTMPQLVDGVREIIRQWIIDNAHVDLRLILISMLKDWAFSRVKSIKDSNAPSDDIETMLDIKEQINRITRYIQILSGEI